MTPKEVWDFLVKLSEQAEQKQISNEDLLQIIGLLKCAQTSLMLRMDSHKYPFEDEEKK